MKKCQSGSTCISYDNYGINVKQLKYFHFDCLFFSFLFFLKFLLKATNGVKFQGSDMREFIQFIISDTF